jgi:hypothetical protein
MDGIFEPDQEQLMNDYMLMLDLIVEGFRNCIVILEKAKATNDFDTIKQGHLVLMSCGHRGKPNR